MGTTPPDLIPEPTAGSTGQDPGTGISVPTKVVDPFMDLETVADAYRGLGVSREGPHDPVNLLAGLTMKEQAATIKSLRGELERTRTDLSNCQADLLAAKVNEGRLEERVKAGGALRHTAHVLIALGTSALTYGLDHWHEPNAGALPLIIFGAVALLIGFFGKMVPGFGK